MQEAVKKYGKSQILNSDQESQFTCKLYLDYFKNTGIQISMDGNGRTLDNIYIEPFWRTIKYQHIYLNLVDSGLELYKGIQEWLEGTITELTKESVEINPLNYSKLLLKIQLRKVEFWSNVSRVLYNKYMNIYIFIKMRR